MTDEGSDAALEPERYELHALPSLSEPTRRQFFATLGAGLVVVVFARRTLAEEDDGRARAAAALAAWIHIGSDGRITVFSGKAEVGQNVRTSLTQAVAEELHAPLSSITVVLADTDKVPFDRGTFGSRSTPEMVPRIRKAAATARRQLLSLAAKRWKANLDTLTVSDGQIIDTAGSRRIGFGALTRGKALLHDVDDAVALTPAGAWRVQGKPHPKVDAAAIVTGQHRYASDIKRPRMLIGKVLRPPRFGVKLSSLVDDEARALAGVQVVRDGDFVGVVARHRGDAERAVMALRPTWTAPASPDPTTQSLFEHLRKTARTADARAEREGDIVAARKRAARTLDASYTAAYIAHVPLEPRAAVAEWKGGKLTVWTGTQRPFGVRAELARAFAIAEPDVRVIVPDTGSGYGGKHAGDAAIEAARLARATRRPVKVTWTREEEMTWAYFRPAALIDIRAAIDNRGLLVAWEMDDYNAGGSGLRTPYQVANRSERFIACDSPLRQGSYRGLAATANTFAREAHMDALAALAGRDPVRFRRDHLNDERLLAVMDAVLARFGWREGKLPTGVGQGLAIGTEKGSVVASCAEIDLQGGSPRVVRLVTAFECGAILNPLHLENQVQGAVIQGLGGALYEAIDFADGQVKNARLSQYEVPRFSDLPKLETVLLDRKDAAPVGAGETPIIAVAPAIANAIAAAGGRRLHGLPLRFTGRTD